MKHLVFYHSGERPDNQSDDTAMRRAEGPAEAAAPTRSPVFHRSVRRKQKAQKEKARLDEPR
ncbi:hypothetical protein [Bradyrhizobium sp. WD16]|uniref:hypothetical protein n=1 Tax=Bradyrhizobium sp. WD16 TaxID=1521768 RepID=UPI0020A2D4B0|nr:hypothetical protein [Bradyrhizobium sp. WD16]